MVSLEGSRRTRVGVVGTGYWARWCHATVLDRRRDVEFVGFYGRSLERAKDAANEVGGEAFDDLEHFLGRVDAVSFAVAPDAQAEIAVRAAQAGKHVLLEKPIALDETSAVEVVEATEAAGVAVQTFMTLLHQDKVITWLRELDDLAAVHGPWDGAALTWTASIYAADSPYAGSAWRRERGGLWDLAPHLLALLDRLLSPVATVDAVRGNNDTVTLSTTHARGETAVVTASIDAPPGTEVAEAMVWGPSGRRRLELPTGSLLEAFDTALDEWLYGISHGTPPHLDARHGLALLRTVGAAERSIAENRRQPVPHRDPAD